MKIENQIDELVQNEIISTGVGIDIKNYYDLKKQSNPNTILITFGIIGALLGGLGIVLILAHNWDGLSVLLKTIIAFIPLIVGQFLCGYSLFKKKNNDVWRESSTAFLFIAIGACIALISQTYHIQGELPSFLMTWMLLALPLIYLMRSSTATILFIAGISYYGMVSGFGWGRSESYYYWLLLLGAFPSIYMLNKSNPTSNFLTIIYWVLSVSLIVVTGTVASRVEILMYLVYTALFGVLYSFGHSKSTNTRKFLANGPRLLGALGILVMFFIFSFDFVWSRMRGHNWWSRSARINWDTAYYSPEFVFSVILFTLATFLIAIRVKRLSWGQIRPLTLFPFVFIPVFALGYYWDYSQLLVNLLILAIGIAYVVEGANKDHLGILNKGLTIIMILTILRFFDTHLSFVFKGVIFMIVGSGFFVANYIVVRKRKKRIQSKKEQL